MPNKCAAFGCKSGYKKATDNYSGPKITFHSFPADKEFVVKWIKAIARKYFEPSKHCRLCSLHFLPNDFIDVSNDSNGTRRKLHPEKPLSLRYLKKDAVPSIFPHAPSYLSRKGSTPRTTKKASTSSQHKQAAENLTLLNESFCTADDVTQLTVEDIEPRLKSETSTTPSGFHTVVIDNALLVFMIVVKGGIPLTVASLTIQRDLTVVAASHGVLFPESRYKDIVDGSVRSMSQLMNLMARLKSWTNDEPRKKSAEFHVETAINSLELAIDVIDDCSSDRSRSIASSVEQLKLLHTNNNN